MQPLVREIDQYLNDRPAIKFYSWMNGIRTKCWQLKMPPPSATEQKYLATCWPHMDTVAEGIGALYDWRRS